MQNTVSTPANTTAAANVPHVGRFPKCTPDTVETAITNTTPNTVTTATPIGGTTSSIQPLADINGLRASGIFPRGREPSLRTLHEWTKRRRIPCHRLGHLVYYDIAEIAAHIRLKLLIPARA